MSQPTLLADPAVITREKIIPAVESLTLIVRTVQPRVTCPRCGTPSVRVHSRYVRSVADLPWQGITVRLELSARRFRCDNDLCPQAIFCEPLPSVVTRYARRTNRLNQTLEEITFALGGRPGSHLAHELAMAVSRHTLLRVIRRAPHADYETPSALGIDDWAKRKGREYGHYLTLSAHWQNCAILASPSSR